MDLCGDMLLDHLPRDGPLRPGGRPPLLAVPPARHPSTWSQNSGSYPAGLGGGRGSGRPRLKPRRLAAQRSRSSPSRPKTGLPWVPAERNCIAVSSPSSGSSNGSATMGPRPSPRLLANPLMVNTTRPVRPEASWTDRRSSSLNESVLKGTSRRASDLRCCHGMAWDDGIRQLWLSGPSLPLKGKNHDSNRKRSFFPNISFQG